VRGMSCRGTAVVRRGIGWRLRRLLAPVLAICCIAAAPPEQGAVPDFFPEGFEEREAAARNLRHRYHEGILITGSEAYISSVKAALQVIEEADSRSWYFVRKQIRRITMTDHTGVDVNGGRVTSREDGPGSAAGLAAQIVHEAWHGESYSNGQPWDGPAAERFCIERQNEFLARLGLPGVDVETALRSEYWKVDYWSRTW
jgi:hypothetical protein